MASAPARGDEVFTWVNDDPTSVFQGTFVFQDGFTGDFGGEVEQDFPELLSWSLDVPSIPGSGVPDHLTLGNFDGYGYNGSVSPTGSLSIGFGGGTGSYYEWYINVGTSEIDYHAAGPYADGETFYDFTDTVTGQWVNLATAPDAVTTGFLVGFVAFGLAFARKRFGQEHGS